MMEFTPSRPGKKDTSAAKILQILAKEHPLTLMGIYRKLKAEHRAEMSFQAVRKAANQLADAGVLAKSREKEYEISSKWIFDSKKFFDGLSKSYRTKAKTRFKAEISNDRGYSEYHLSNLFELDNFWTDVLIHWADNFEKSEPKITATYNNCHWWFLINLGNEMSLWKYIIDKVGNCTFVMHKMNFINDIAIKSYKLIGGKAAYTDNPPFPHNVDVNVCGDYIIQVTFPDKIMQKLDNLAKKCKSTDDVTPEMLNDIMETKCDITMICMKNKEMARAYRERIIASAKA